MRGILLLIPLLGLVPFGGCNKPASDSAKAPAVVSSSASGTGPIELRTAMLGERSASQMVYDSEGGMILVGSEEIWPAGETIKNDIAIAGLDPAGRELWRAGWGTEHFEQARILQLDQDGNIYIAGAVNDPTDDNLDFLVLKYSPDGELLWEQAWGTEHTEIVSAFTIDEDQNVYAGGMSYVRGKTSPTRSILMKLGSSGEQLAALQIGSGTFCKVQDISVSGDRVWVAADFETDEDGHRQGLVLNLSRELSLQWAVSLAGSDYTVARFVSASADGTAFVTGRMKTDRHGRLLDIFNMTFSPDGDVVAAGLYAGMIDKRLKDAFTTADGRQWLFGTSDSGVVVVQLDHSSDEAVAWTSDSGDQPTIPLFMAQNPDSTLELYTEKPLANITWTETRLPVEDYPGLVNKHGVEISATEISPYVPDSFNSRTLH